MVNKEMKKLSPRDFTKLLQDHEAVINNSHFLISTGPLAADRTSPERKVISAYVLERICEQVFKNQVGEIRRLYTTLQDWSTTMTAAGMIFKYRVHRFFRKSRVIKLFPIIASNRRRSIHTTDTKEAGETFTLPKSEELVFVDKPDIPPEVGTYYRPRNTHFPAIDSWLLFQPTLQGPPILLAFQITPDKDECDVDMNGLARVDNLVTADTKKYLIIVTPTGVQPKIIMPEGYPTEAFPAGHGPDVAFTIYHLQIRDGSF